jgi:FkbH-like protein
MFEFDKYDRRAHGERLRPGPEGFAFLPRSEVAELSMLFWSEHCIECAAPDCYAACDLYEPRSDGRCRRFTYGIYRNGAFPSLRGAGAEVTFKTWGRLKANGNTRMEPVSKVLWKERLVGWGLTAADAFGGLLFNITGDPRWKTWGPDPDNRFRRLHRRNSGGRRPDAFLMEVYNPSSRPVTVHLQMRIGEDLYDPTLDPTRVPAPFAAAVTLASGYSRHAFERSRFQAIVESGLPFKMTLVPEGESQVTLVFLTLDFIRYRIRSSDQPIEQNIKCVVFDLDNTLWTGVLLEDDAVRARDDALRLIQALDRRGILLGIASKNDEDHALAKLESLGLAEYFLHPEINWAPKSESLKRISAALNIGLDTFAFVDDSPFEREEVARALPQVMCVDATGDLGWLLDDPRFRGGGSVDAGNRRSYYRDAIIRDRDLRTSGGDYLEFLASSRIELEVCPYQPGDFERVAELAQRTNRLNFSGTRYTRDDLRRSLADGGPEAIVLRCSDRYGSYGTVGLSLVRRAGAEVRVEEFMLSCRVQGKFIEQAFFDHLTRRPGAANGEPARRLWVNFHPTQRNAPARQTLERLGFRPDGDGEGLLLDVTARPLICDFIETVIRRAPEEIDSCF